MAKGRCSDPVKEAERARKISEARRRRMAEDGFLNSPEVRSLMSEAARLRRATPETRAKMSASKKGRQPANFEQALAAAHATPPLRGADNPSWKGGAVGYGALHAWVGRQLGRPRRCEHCGSTEKRRYEWANVSGEYRRDLADWVRLCKSCHFLMDRTPEMRSEISRIAANAQWTQRRAARP